MRMMMSKLKLTVNETKTRICYLPEEKFDFLGVHVRTLLLDAEAPRLFRHGPIQETGTAHLSKLVQRICRAISGETGRDTIGQTPQALVDKLNRMLIGWANYFCLGAVSKAYSALDMHARWRLRRWLCDKHKEARPGYKRFPEGSLHGVYGLVQLPHRIAGLPWAKA
jgi:RNA-directed DNA polymerase